MKRVHFMGIGGSGASAAAGIALKRGFEITGCDKNPFNEFTQTFSREILFEGHNPNHLQNTDLLVITPAITSLDPDNPELLEAKKRKIKILSWQKFLGKFLTKDKFVIAVCGTHGKSTTTAMIGLMLEDANLDPTVELGAIIPRWGSNFRVGTSKYFVVEADEFNDNYLSLDPDITVLTNIDFDHPEFFKDFTAYKRSFQNFLYKAKLMIIANLENPVVSEILALHFGGVATHTKSFFKPVVDFSKILINFPLKVPGDFNILNASAAYQVGLNIGLSEFKIRQSLMNFEGIGRRFEYLGSINDAKVFSDFAHHPKEIEVTLKAAREKFQDKKIWAIFQPHMFSRTKALFNDFVKVFQNADVDQTYIIDIYPSREVDTGLVSSKQLTEATNKNTVRFVDNISDLLTVLAKATKQKDVLFFIGAGDIDNTARQFVNQYGKRV